MSVELGDRKRRRLASFEQHFYFVCLAVAAGDAILVGSLELDLLVVFFLDC